MNELQVAGAGTAAVAAALATVLLLLHPRLAATMGELCGEAERGRFWTSMAETCAVAGTLLWLLMGMLVTPLVAPRGTPALALAAVLSLLRWGLAGLLASLGVVGAAVLAFTARLGTHTPPPHGAGSLPPRRG